MSFGWGLVVRLPVVAEVEVARRFFPIAALRDES